MIKFALLDIEKYEENYSFVSTRIEPKFIHFCTSLIKYQEVRAKKF